MTDPRTPVVVGVGQCEQRVDDPATAREPIELLADAARAAAADAGCGLLGRVDAVGVVQVISWRYGDPGARVAEILGITPTRTTVTGSGGNGPQLLLNSLAATIARNEHDVVLIGGAEAYASRQNARRARPKIWLDWPKDQTPATRDVIGGDRPGTNEYENAHGADDPLSVYPLFETALRRRAGHGVARHQRFLGDFYARFAAVAAGNPHAWDRTPYTAEQIATPARDNRIIGFPYTKRMCAYSHVDQAAALLMCSLDTARAAGVAEERMVFLHSGADANDHWWFTERESLAASPGIAAVTGDALRAAALEVDDVARFDLYSCFPSAVQLAVDALGLTADDPRGFTVTGGLAFAGGPWNDYPTHSIATMVEACRRDPGTYGLVTALGWYATKHSCGIYSTEPPRSRFRRVDPATTQARIDARPRRPVPADHRGTAEIEATCVMHGRDGEPALAIVSALTPDGARVLANSTDHDTMVAMTTEAWEGRTVRIDGNSGRHTLRG